MARRTRTPRRRRGAHAVLMGATIMMLLGFAALALDTAYMLLVRSQAQGIADAASMAAMVALRRTGDVDKARDAAEETARQNLLGGGLPDPFIEFGTWDDTQLNPTFQPGEFRPNAARATISRDGSSGVRFLLATLFGHERFDVSASAVSAARSADIALVLDITGSWGEAGFAEARAAVLHALDLLEASTSEADRVAMTIFTNRFSWLYTPWAQVAQPGVADQVRADWSVLNIASKGGVDIDPYDGIPCQLHPLASRNDFTNPPGGCYPHMPREYTDEPGTDHSTGILQAKEIYEALPGGASFRAMVVITDGRPNALGANSGAIRESQGFQETRWDEYKGPVPRTANEIRHASVAATGDLWDNLRVHTWVVSLIEDDWSMGAMTRGDGYYVLTQDGTQLAAILGAIIAEMPLAVVQ